MKESVRHFSEFTDAAPYLAQGNHVVGSFGRYRRDYVEMFAVTEGHGELVTYPDGGGRRVHDILPGRLVMFRPMDSIRFAPSTRFSALFVSFRNADWVTFAGLVRLHPTWVVDHDPPMASFDTGDPSALEPFETAMRQSTQAPTALDIVRFCLGVVPVLFPENRWDALEPRVPDWLLRSIDAMAEESCLRGGLSRWLELAQVSTARLATATGRYFGKTPTALLREIRLRHAAELLTTTLESVQIVAQRSGWDNLAHFSTSFRRAYRVTPRDYRMRAHASALATRS